MKNIFLSLIIICITAGSKAQKTAQKDYTFSAGAELAYAIGKFHSNHTLGFGLSGQTEYLFSDNASLTMNAGFISFATKSVNDTLPSGIVSRAMPAVSIYPITMGMKIYFDGDFYVHPQVGMAFRTGNTIAANYCIGTGIRTGKHADFSLRYQALIKKGVVATFFGVRAAYEF